MKLQVAGTVKRLNVEHRTSNIERRILMTLRFIYFKTSEPQNVEYQQRLTTGRSTTEAHDGPFDNRGSRRAVRQQRLTTGRSTQKLTTGRIHSFDIRHSLFDIRFFRVSFSIRPAVFLAGG
jgi:hypothetical protein